MKSDTERKKFYQEKLHKRRSRLHVHLSKDLRGKLKSKKRAVLVRKGDTVRIMRGPEKGKEGKVGNVDYINRKITLEGVVVTNTRGREMPIPLEASNLLLLSLESTPARKAIFSEEAFRKKEAPKPPKVEEKKAEAHEEHKGHEHKHAEAEKPKAEHMKGETSPAKAEHAKGTGKSPGKSEHVHE